MDFGRIIALIDEELDRLQKARHLLASLTGSSLESVIASEDVLERRNGETAPPEARAAAESSPGVAEASESPVDTPEQSAPNPARRVAKAERSPRKTRSAPASAATQRPLGPPVHDRPIFVSAANLSSRPVKAAPGNEGAHRKPESPSLTAESLAQRWLPKSLSQ